MQEQATGLVDRGYPVSEATLYIYCDACGSFSIKRYIHILKILVLAGIAAGIVKLKLSGIEWFWCLAPLLMMGMFLPWRDMLLSYKCRKCGNGHISEVNTLHYPAYDRSVVDVPDRLTQKRYVDTDTLNFEQFT